MDPQRIERRRTTRAYQVDATAFLHEILLTADRLEQARNLDGRPAMHRDPQARVLRAIDRCGGAPTFTYLGRLMGISRQAAREHALAAVRAGVVELWQAPGERRAWQIVMTPAGRRELERQRMPQLAWIGTLLRGLHPLTMRSTQRVLHVIRLRLERDARELKAASARR
jgi:DNA-binding MarR family transcriptional regulator